MKSLVALGCALLFAILLVGCTADTGGEMGVNEEEVRQAIEAANARFELFVSNQNVDNVAALYSSDGQLMAPGSEIASGENIANSFEDMLAAGVTEIDLQTIEVEAADDFAYEVGEYTIQGPGGVAVDNGKYVVIWKEENGEWKLHRDIFNSNVSAAPDTASADTTQQM